MEQRRGAVRGWAVGVVVLLAGCAGGGPYGFSRTYEPLSAEEPYADQEQVRSYEEVRRDPQGHGGVMLGWFGTVVEVKERGDVAEVALELRFHQDRHLCGDEGEDSCRVTITEREGGPFSARLHLRPEDRTGRLRVGPGSLLKVYGTATEAFDERGGPVLDGVYYRHFPTGTFVTTGITAQKHMRR